MIAGLFGVPWPSIACMALVAVVFGGGFAWLAMADRAPDDVTSLDMTWCRTHRRWATSADHETTPDCDLRLGDGPL